MVMKHPEYKKATNEYQGRNEQPGLPKSARLSFKERMIAFGKHVEEVTAKLGYSRNGCYI
jgi:hypothetical protein